MKRGLLPLKAIGKLFIIPFLLFTLVLQGQTNVFDDVIATSPNHTSLKAALEQEGLDAALQDVNASLTVFAPDDAAFDALAVALGTDLAGLLALPDLDQILLYHVLGVTVTSDAVMNGDIVTPLNAANTLKLTKTSMGDVFVNQAQVNAADLTTDNGVLHSVNAVVLPAETVVDVAIDNGFSTLATAVITAELIPALSDPFASYTVFAPTNAAFDAAVESLGIDIPTLLTLPNLGDILTYHVLGTEVTSDMISNGDIVMPLSMTNTLKLTATSMGEVFVNQAQVMGADVDADNGVVHILDAVVLPSETVVDVAIDNGFSTLATAVITAELIPALSDPFASYTVFAPTNAAFDAAVESLGIDIPTLLTLPNLGDILTYHVLGTEVTSDMISNGDIVMPLSMTNTLKLTATSMGEVFVNQAQVTGADVDADNGVVHILDAVVLPSETVVDVAIDNGFSTLATAVITAELIPALSDPFASYTVFAPTNAAFDAAVESLGIDIPTLLTLPNLGDILTYHVLGTEVTSDMISNGDIVMPLSMTNTLKLTATSMGEVFVNQAQVTGADVDADNGVVHILDAVVLPSETVVDVAIDNGFSTLTTAVITAELIPALSDPFSEFTVFAPTNDAFDTLVSELGIDIPTLLALPNLGNILAYHVVSGTVLSTDLMNGDVVTLSGESITVDLTNGVMINDAMVTTADVLANNGVVHIIDKVLIPATTASREVENVLPLNYFPNPTTDVVYLTGIMEGDFQVFDINGKMVNGGILTDNMVRVDDLARGTYILRVLNENTVHQAKLIKL